MRSFLLASICIVITFAHINAQEGVAINNASANPDASAMLDVTSTVKGILIPRMTLAQRNLISSPSNSLLIYQTNSAPGFYYYESTAAKWLALKSTGLENITENSKDGWRLVGATPAHYGNIGNYALDLSLSGVASTSNGATGNYSFASGRRTEASGVASVAMGYNTSAVSDYSFASGYETQAGFDYAFASGYKSIASGSGSIAMGYEAEATTSHATAIGLRAKATGFYSFAGGNLTTASGQASFSIGQGGSASGDYSSSLGLNTTASGRYSTSLGYNTQATNDASTAMGHYSLASGVNSTAMGRYTIASGYYSTAMGHMTSAPSGFETAMGRWNTIYSPNDTSGWNSADRLFVIGNGTGNTTRSNALIIFKDGTMNINDAYTMPAADGSASQVLTTDGAGNVSWGVPSSGTDDQNIVGSALTGTNLTIGIEGGSSDTVDLTSLSQTGLEKITEGSNSGWRLVGAIPAHYGDIGTEAVDFSFSSNFSTTNGATGNYSTAFGYNNVASNFASVAYGYQTTASGNSSIAIGANSIASGDVCTAIGHTALATGHTSTAIGAQVTSNGDAATAIGFGCQANGNWSTALGYLTHSDADYSTAMGYEARASANVSTALGFYTTSQAFAETAIGMYNTLAIAPDGSSWVGNDRLFVIGNGTGVATPNDALIVFKNGNATLSGTLTQSSDLTLKNTIKPLEMSLANIAKIGGYSYFWKDTMRRGDERQIGLIAQEVEAIYPELVRKDGNGKLTLNYSGLVPVLLEATKEQQEIIEDLKAKNQREMELNKTQEEEIKLLKGQIKEIQSVLNKLKE